MPDLETDPLERVQEELALIRRYLFIIMCAVVFSVVTAYLAPILKSLGEIWVYSH